MSLVLVLVLAYVPALAGREVLRAWGHEDGPVESLGAAAFLAASVVFGAAWWRSRRSGREWWTRRLLRGHPGYFALCAILFVACMEEISWGQRVLGFKTPDAIARVNRQGEINIHNLAFFHGLDRDHHRKTSLELSHNLDRLFSAFNIVLGVVLPLAARQEKWRGGVDRLGVPLLSLGVGVLFLANYGVSKVLERFASAHAVVEIKECNAALIWLALGVVAFLAVREGTARSPAAAGSVLPAEGLTVR
ncbi:MAG TPA: hypothetical protein VFQ51_00785 [Vicinamibacteria bacterium]|nr:hypothetical protein [Vicinamibacteria bacterium]